jgi:hypothetical protein
MMRSKRQSAHMLSTQSQTVLGILSYTSVRTTGPTSSRWEMASKDACGVSRSTKKEHGTYGGGDLCQALGTTAVGHTSCDDSER